MRSVGSTGRCGTTTFARACEHISNFSAAHESRIGKMQKRVKYPKNHIEVDNRLSWFLGRLDHQYGDDAFYVHQKRDRSDTAESLARGSYKRGIVETYRKKILLPRNNRSPIQVCRHYYETVNSNIELFLKDKSRYIEFCLESAEEDFQRFWDRIGAKGDREAALREWGRKYNASDPKESPSESREGESRDISLPARAIRKALRIARELPRFLREA